jgi:hypothetical protein
VVPRGSVNEDLPVRVYVLPLPKEGCHTIEKSIDEVYVLCGDLEVDEVPLNCSSILGDVGRGSTVDRSEQVQKLHVPSKSKLLTCGVIDRGVGKLVSHNVLKLIYAEITSTFHRRHRILGGWLHRC